MCRPFVVDGYRENQMSQMLSQGFRQLLNGIIEQRWSPECVCDNREFARVDRGMGSVRWWSPAIDPEFAPGRGYGNWRGAIAGCQQNGPIRKNESAR